MHEPERYRLTVEGPAEHPVATMVQERDGERHVEGRLVGCITGEPRPFGTRGRPICPDCGERVEVAVVRADAARGHDLASALRGARLAWRQLRNLLTPGS